MGENIRAIQGFIKQTFDISSQPSSSTAREQRLQVLVASLRGSREVELLNSHIHKKIKVGDCDGMVKLAETYGMPYLQEHLSAALTGGHLKIVRHLVEAGVPTHRAIEDCLSAPKENVEVLKFLIEKGVKLDYPNVPSAISSRYLESARLLLAHDQSGTYLRVAAEHLGMIEGGIEAIETLCALAGPQYRRDILEYAMQGAVRRRHYETIVQLFERGARGDRVVWKWGLYSAKDATRFREVFSRYEAPLPAPARFPLASLGNNARSERLREEVIKELQAHTGDAQDGDTSARYAEKYRQADEIIQKIVSSNIISEPLLDAFGASVVARLVNACKVHDVVAFRTVIETHREILDPRYYLLDQLAGSGSAPVVKAFVEEFGADVNQHEGLALAVAAHEGYIDILEYLIVRGADVHAYQEAALCEASRMSNAEVVHALLKHGADPRAHRSRFVYDCARQMGPKKHTPALRSAKFLIDAGASPRLFSPESNYERGPAAEYARFMAAIGSPQSPLYLKTLESRLNDSHINFSLPTHINTPVFRFASSCAAVAARFFASIENPKLFVSLFKNGMSKVLDAKAGTFRNLAVAADADIDLFQDAHDVAGGALWDVIIPILVTRRDELPPRLDDVILARVNSLAFAVGQELFADRSVTEILKFSRIWHRPDKQIPIDAKPLRANSYWHPLLESHEGAGDYSVHSLVTNEALVLEGAIMHHCLGGGSYTSSCLQGTFHILSLRKNGIPRGTVAIGHVPPELGEFHLPSGRALAVLQFRGPGNSEADAETAQFFTKVKSMIRTGKLPLWDGPWGETDASRANRTRLGISMLEGMTGIRSGEYPELAATHYRDVLTVPGTQKDASGHSPKIGLLDSARLERIISACRAVLAGPPDKPPREPEDISWRKVVLKKSPSKALMFAWEVQSHLKLLGELLLPPRNSYLEELRKLSLPRDGRPLFRTAEAPKAPPHYFLDL